MGKRKSGKSRNTSGPGPKGHRETQGQKRQIEQYAHADKKRVNNPPVGLVTPQTDPMEPPRKTYQYDPHLDPQLVWAGKAERTSFEVPNVSLHVHERIDPKSIIQAVRTNGNGKLDGDGGPPRQRSLFETREANPPLRDALDFYKHPHGWTNRLIAGDSVLVMNSLLEKEGMAGKVQMVYIDPPYGIRYASNFQPFVNRRDVKDKDEDLSQEPETIKAFRDTWEIGVHSYLTNLRDRLLLARDLLHESGSVFVQISDDNLHHVRELMDEVFGRENFLSNINFQSMTPLESGHIENVFDYVIWYARNKKSMKYRNLFQPKVLEAGGEFKFIDTQDGRLRELSPEELANLTDDSIRKSVFKRSALESTGFTATCTFPFEYGGQEFRPRGGKSWRTTRDGMAVLASHGRLFVLGSKLYFKLYYRDFPFTSLVNSWPDTVGGFSETKRYAVQTHPKIIRRCMLMTTDPGDLVFDPTCGSGTTAFVAEQWGRRWITCDTSRVAITLAKQWLMTAVFDYYQLADPDKGIADGLVYKTVPHVTLKSIANNPYIKLGMNRADVDTAIRRHAEQETLYDQPLVDKSKARVTGPFTVEAVPAINVRQPEQATESRPLALDSQKPLPGVGRVGLQEELPLAADVSITRYGESLRQRQWRDELAAAGVRGKAGQRMQFARLEPLPGCRWLNAEGETTESRPQRVALSFGPEHAPLEQRQVEQAWEEARTLSPRPDILLFAAFHFDPEAAKDIDELDAKKAGMLLLRVQMNTDLLTDDLKKKRASNESFWLIGQPDVELRQLKKGDHTGHWQVEVLGFDYYNPTTGKIESGDTSKIAMWLLDPDYDGRSLFPRQVFFPLAGDKEGWARLAKNLKAEIDEELIEAYRGTESLPFVGGQHRRVAVKIIDDRGIESLKVLPIEV